MVLHILFIACYLAWYFCWQVCHMRWLYLATTRLGVRLLQVCQCLLLTKLYVWLILFYSLFWFYYCYLLWYLLYHWLNIRWVYYQHFFLWLSYWCFTYVLTRLGLWTFLTRFLFRIIYWLFLSYILCDLITYFTIWFSTLYFTDYLN